MHDDCSIDIEVDEDGIEDALKRLRRLSYTVLAEIRKRRRDGPKPSVKRRNRHWFRENYGFAITYAAGRPFLTTVTRPYRCRGEPRTQSR